MGFYEDLNAALETLDHHDQRRGLTALEPQGRVARLEGRDMINFSSNDYLGLSGEGALTEEFSHQFRRDERCAAAFSASSSRLLTGNHPWYTELEDLLGTLYEGKDALVFNSGYHANSGILPALAGPGDLILADKLNHASLMDGMRLSPAKWMRYPHLSLTKLESLLEKHREKFKNVFIVTESLFSMDGDRADLSGLSQLAKRFDCVLIVDEAHAVGVCGKRGLGLCEETGLIQDIDIIVGTFGKALCSMGAYGIMRAAVKEYLINRMRPFIFTTALPPINTAWSRFILEKSLSMTGQREHLIRLGQQLRRGLREKGFETRGQSQIVPLLCGDNAQALKLADSLSQAGILVFAIRPPTVPRGEARLRFSLTASHSEDDIKGILEVL